MNRRVRQVGLLAALMVFALLGNLTYFNLARQPGLLDDPANRRVRDAQFDRQRGQILAGDIVIADTVPADPADDFKRQRVYPAGDLYAAVTGFYSYIYGSAGLESSYNSYLTGADDSQWWQSLIDSMSGRSPVGATVTTTLDPTLQQVARQQLGDRSGAVVALDPHDGSVLALVTTPSYDPNRLASHDLAAVQAAWPQLVDDPAGSMRNRAAREIYPPGSTFKLVTAAAALEAGYTPDSLIDTPSQIQLPQSSAVLPNSTRCGNGQVTLAYALQLSCNTSFANIGADLGLEALRRQAERFGFNQPHLSELGGVSSRFPRSGDAAQTMMSAIGQYEVAASPLQMAMVVAAIANDGLLVEPHIVSQVRSADLTVLYQHSSERSQALSVGSAQALQQMMVQVVESGTGSPARLSGVRVGGKTGTAQSSPDRPPYAWFVAFSENPDLVVAVFIEQANLSPGDDVAGGRLGGPIARALIEARR
ncbi:MAG: penicillin-binding protein 2 [Propionibacteriaceae bacterium]|jgi:peptidoglycan glycosyltransferase|nr:penicillin-binding protein 2 [Propionibacteriaceae bacterium]